MHTSDVTLFQPHYVKSDLSLTVQIWFRFFVLWLRSWSSRPRFNIKRLDWKLTMLWRDTLNTDRWKYPRCPIKYATTRSMTLFMYHISTNILFGDAAITMLLHRQRLKISVEALLYNVIHLQLVRRILIRWSLWRHDMDALPYIWHSHYSNVRMNLVVSQICGNLTVYSTVRCG